MVYYIQTEQEDLGGLGDKLKLALGNKFVQVRRAGEMLKVETSEELTAPEQAKLDAALGRKTKKAAR